MGYQIQTNVFSEKRMTPVEAAYLAGLVDGEGSILLLPHRTRGRQSHSFVAELSVANSNHDLLRRVVEMTGNGRIMLNRRPASSNHKPVGVWQLSPRQVPFVLRQIVPFLVAKRRQAEIVLRFIELRQGGPMAINGMPTLAIADVPEVLALYAELRVLNRRGLTEPETLEFSVREAAERTDRLCSVTDCRSRCYRGQEQCYQHWLQQREPVLKNCEWCGGEMDAIMPHRRFCSPKCQWRSGYKRRKNE